MIDVSDLIGGNYKKNTREEKTQLLSDYRKRSKTPISTHNQNRTGEGRRHRKSFNKVERSRDTRKNPESQILKDHLSFVVSVESSCPGLTILIVTDELKSL